jgi:hypothetical protein
MAVCRPLITFEPLGKFSWNLVRTNDIQRDFDAIIVNPIASIILNVLLFTVVRLALLSSGFGLFMFHGNQVVYCKLM